MLTADQAYDLWTNPHLFDRWFSQQSMSWQQAKKLVRDLAAEDLLNDEPRSIRMATAAQKRRGKLDGRTDVAEICQFMDKAVGIPLRVQQVYQLCILRGLTRKEAAAQLGIAVETVRAHLRRLRLYVRKFGEPRNTSSRVYPEN